MHKFDRQTLARFLPNPQAIATFERLLSDVNGTPSTIEEAHAVAAQALATAASALSMLAETAAMLEQLTSAPAALVPADADDCSPRAQLGTISAQNADAVEITGGIVENTPIGTTTRSTGRFNNVGVGTATPIYRFVVSNEGNAGIEFDPNGTAFGAGTTGILAYNRAGSAYVPLHVAALSMTFRATNTVRFSIDASGIGFFGATPIAKPNVSGSRGGNAALASLLTSLAALGLISDGTAV